MELEPRGLGIPLHPRNWFWVKAAGACGIAALLLAWLAPDLGLLFLASLGLALPLPLVFRLTSWRLQRGMRRLGSPVQWLAVVAVFLYIRFAGTVLLPWVLEALERIGAG